MRKSQLYKFGPFVLDPQQHELTKDGELVPLSPHEFILLRELVKHNNRVVTTEHLCNQLRPSRELGRVDSNVIYWLINRLREKLSDFQAIQTIRQRGYVLRAEVEISIISRGADTEKVKLTRNSSKKVKSMPKHDSPSRALVVFLCHSSGDKPVVRNLHRRLSADGFSPWLDEEDLDAGQEWEREIPKAVRDSDVVLVCLSQDSINKKGYVQKEIKFALDVADEQPEGTVYIIPAKLEECDVPERLKRWQWVSLHQEDGYDRLIRSLRRRAEDLGIEISAKALDETVTSNNIYGESGSLEADTHMLFPCELKKGDKINIDLKSDEPVDVLIMDKDDYQEWHDKGEVNFLYKEFTERDNLHAFFTAPEDDNYLVIVRNESDSEVDVEINISLV
jgi:DNA-binding winged helix-turn-helix (wHTH) protein